MKNMTELYTAPQAQIISALPTDIIATSPDDGIHLPMDPLPGDDGGIHLPGDPV